MNVRASGDTFREHAGYTQYHREIPIWKNKHDMARYARILTETRPDVVVETGTRWGGFAAWMHDTFGMPVITVDIDAAMHNVAREMAGITLLNGKSSIELQVIDRVTAMVAQYDKVMVTLDSDHHAYHVGCEIQAYSDLVTRGCYLVVEDALADFLVAGGWGDEARRFGRRIPEEGGPLPAIEATLLKDGRFERDLEIEGMTSISHSPVGWWKRVGP
ncbi:MAG TPA: CmcI family methyltransferase [Jiangellaceae bacterium]|nr:CmcI family methyltransferase [Jiangellaceae bacterium]